MTPRFEHHREDIAAALSAVRRACDPFELVRRSQPPEANWGVLSIGKAAPAMDAACPSPLGRRLVITTEGTELWGAPEFAEIVDHPLPTDRNLRATERMLRWLELPRSVAAGHDAMAMLDRVDPARMANLLEANKRQEIPLVLLLSGGASACLASPMPGITLENLRDVTDALLRAGCAIDELNTVRRHLELFKGGRLAAHLAPVPIMAYILSDVVSDDIAAIGSGPVSADSSTFADALAIVHAHGVAERVPGVTAFLEQGAQGHHPETLKPGDTRLDRVTTQVVGSWATGVHAAANALRDRGFEVASLGEAFQGEATACARRVGDHARALRARATVPLALVMGGESTVRVGQAKGRGGRNQELALAAAREIAGMQDVAIATFATDGIDGPTDAAGAIVTGLTLKEAQTRGIDLVETLLQHDSFTVLSFLGSIVRTGPTGTNVNDLILLLVY